MPNVDVQNPRLPQFGQASGFDGGISADVYEQYAPQMVTTARQQADMGRGYQMRRDIFEEEQAQLDAKIAQSRRAEELRKAGRGKLDKKAEKARRMQAAGTGASIGGATPLGPLGAVIGGGIGYMFGNEGGYVPEIHPRSMLYKEYQQGGTVTGYKGEGKFGRRGLQNLRMRETDLNRLSDNVDKMGKYGFWDAAMDVGKGYSAGQDVVGSEGFSNLMTGLKDVKQYGLVDAVKHHAARTGGLGDFGNIMGMFGFDQDKFLTGAQDTFKENITRVGKQQNPWIEKEETQSLLDFLPKNTTSKVSDSFKHQQGKIGYNLINKSPVRDTVFGGSDFEKTFRNARKGGQKYFMYKGKKYNTELA